MADWVADCSVAHPSVATLVNAGAIGAMRYMDPGRNDGTEITVAELADYAAHGLPYGLVMEYSADWLEGGYAVGHDRGLASLADEQRLGIPPGVLYLACDFDIQPAQYAAAYACIQGAADARGGWDTVGVYGSKAFCEWVGAGGMVKHFWSTDAWSNYIPAANAQLHQHAQWPSDVPVVPGCDHNLVLGDWAPRTGGDDLTPEQDTILRTCARAIYQLGGAVTQLQGAVAKLATDEGVRAQLIEHGDATHKSLNDLATAVAAVPAATVDPQPIVAGVVAGVKAQFAKAAA